MAPYGTPELTLVDLLGKSPVWDPVVPNLRFGPTGSRSGVPERHSHFGSHAPEASSTLLRTLKTWVKPAFDAETVAETVADR